MKEDLPAPKPKSEDVEPLGPVIWSGRKFACLPVQNDIGKRYDWTRCFVLPLQYSMSKVSLMSAYDRMPPCFSFIVQVTLCVLPFGTAGTSTYLLVRHDILITSLPAGQSQVPPRGLHGDGKAQAKAPSRSERSQEAFEHARVVDGHTHSTVFDVQS